MPVLTVPIVDEENNAINTENDDVVRVLQQSVRAGTVINLIEAPGFLEDKDDESTLIQKMSPLELEAREQQVDGRMKRKMLAVRKLFEARGHAGRHCRRPHRTPCGRRPCRKRDGDRMNVKDLEERYVLPVYPRRDLVLVRGKAAKLYDEEGREYIDCASNVGVSNIGHGNESVAKAIYEQYLTLGNCYAMFYNPVRARLAEKLVSLAPGRLKKVFFCNSGAEAVEGAIKFARASTGKTGIIAAMRGFHGKTFGALAATWGTEYQKPFEPMLAGITHIPYNNFAKLKESVTKDTAAVILEPVQGEGGVRVGDKELFPGGPGSL